MWVRRENPYGVREEQEMEPGDILRRESQSWDSYMGADEPCPQRVDLPGYKPCRANNSGRIVFLSPKDKSCVCLHGTHGCDTKDPKTDSLSQGERKKLGVEGLAQTGIGSADLGLESRAEGRGHAKNLL